MKWRRGTPPAGAEAEPQGEDVTPSEETLRAREAARAAGRQLAEVRARSPKIARSGDELARLNEHNGFALLIRQALGSG
jgi:hypothetical protein